MTTAYLAAEGFADQLQEELRRAGAPAIRRHERLLVCDGPAIAAAWAANIWHDCVELPVASIGSAAQALRDMQRNWAMYAPLHHRRANADPGTPAARFGQARRFPGGSACSAAGVMDLAGARPAARRPALQLALCQRRGGFRPGQDRPAQPRLPQAVGGAGAARPLAGTGRALPRSRRLARRLDLCPGQAGRQRDRRRQGAARSQGDGDGGRGNGAARAPSPWNRRASGRSTGCSPTSSAIRTRLLRLVEKWRASGLVTELRLHHQVPGRDRSRVG